METSFIIRRGSAFGRDAVPEAEYPICGGRMIIIETFARGCPPEHHSNADATAIRIDTS